MSLFITSTANCSGLIFTKTVDVDAIDDWEELQALPDEEEEEEDYTSYEMIDYTEDLKAIRQGQAFDIVLNGVLAGILLMGILFGRVGK